jgi:hypothetical protein
MFSATKTPPVSSLTKNNLIMRNIFLSFLAVCTFQNALAQLTAKVVDASTGETIPYANIQVNGTESLISNAEGYFTISDAFADDASNVAISYLGYANVKMTVGQLKDRQMTVSLVPQQFELDEVQVSKRPTAEAIMATVKKNLKQNYSTAQVVFKDKVFTRESSSFVPKQFNVEITKSTGFSKNALKTVNHDIDAFMSTLVKHPAREFTDMLAHYYTAPGKDNTIATKLDVVKATKLKDDNRSASMEGLQDKATDIFLKHLDTTKYYRVKSGWFGSRDTVSLRSDYNKKKKKKAPKTELTSAKSRLFAFLNESNPLYNAKLDFINKPELYAYKYEGTVYTGGEDFAYVLSFAPDSRKASYEGKLYISQADFAVIRADYALAPGKKLSGFNMKLLLGIKVAENVSTGTLIYKQRPSGEGYGLQYASKEEGQYLYLNRPLKFIELSDEEKDVVALDLKIEGDMVSKTEYLDLARDGISQADFDGAKEAEFKYSRINRYDPNVWKDHGAIEPLQEMKRFKVGEDVQ